MYGEKYIWFTTAAIGTTWYHKTSPFEKTCSPAQLRAAINGYFYVTRMDLRNDGARSESGMVNTMICTFPGFPQIRSSISTYSCRAEIHSWKTCFTINPMKNLTR